MKWSNSLYLTLKTCENISNRIADSLMFPLTRLALQNSISHYNVGTLDELMSVNIHDFGIFIELQPDEEEKQLLENNIQAALAQQTLDIEDAIDLREIKNIKLANQLLKVRRKKKLERDQKMQQENIIAQTQANTQAQQAAAQMEIQKKQSESESMQQLEEIKAGFESQRMMQETERKKQLMDHEFEIKIRIAKREADDMKSKEDGKEDRKDERTKIQATQQSELIDQRKNDSLPKNFESAGFDNLGGFGLEQFTPR